MVLAASVSACTRVKPASARASVPLRRLATAHVTYSSSNPSVAKVSPNGQLTAVSPGVATIGATVGGVTGFTPIVVQEPMSLTALASLVTPGSSFTVRAILPNPAGAAALQNVNLTLTAPSGWTVQATSPTSFGLVPGGQETT
jgi:beta-glucosidase